MSSILNVGSRALIANQTALQTAGNNIANVNTPGYSRQSVVLQTVQGQFTGGGYIGNGVSVETIQRSFSLFLTRQSTLASAVEAADSTRADKLTQLEGIFEGGTSGLGATINDMLNAFSDVASAPTDLTARTVVLTRIDETASRMRAASQRLDDLQQGVTQELGQAATAINRLAHSIAAVNEEIALAQGSGQAPNDLLDRRDQLVRDLNQYVQTSSIMADDGTVGIFLGGSQALVLGTTVSHVSIVQDEFGDPLKSKLAITRSGQSVILDENSLGGGALAGLLRFQNTDLAEGRNLLGRLTLAISTSLNAQHQMGLDMDGNPGGPLFTPTPFTASNVLAPAPPAQPNSTGASLTLAIADPSRFVASDYEVNLASPTQGTITRRSDGFITELSLTPPSTVVSVDGLQMTLAGSAGDRFLVKPFSTAASQVSSQFASPRALAMASPIAASTGSSNQGTLAVAQLASRSATALAAVTLTFDGLGHYTRSDTGATLYTYTPGQAIESAPATVPASPGWSLTLKGAPASGDTLTVLPQPAANRNLNVGNASALLALRDAALFDGAALSDGYAGLMSQIGIRTQSAHYTAEISSTLAANLERDRTGIAGVNLDEEAAKLLQYQQAYQASAKMIQMAQSIFDTLIQSLGR